MILRALEVEGFRCFDRPVTLSGFAPGLNVVSGPNGAGKSTLLRALRHVLVDAHSLSGASVKQAMAPWGRALNPRIRVEFAHRGTEWRLEKRFLAGASARLERQEGGVFRPVAEGKEAEAAVREMLLAEAAPRGMAAETHLGLLQVLWTPQGPPALPEWSAGVRATLQEAFGAALSSRAADQLAERVEERVGIYFTATGQGKKSSPVTGLQQEELRLREEVQRLTMQWQAAGQSRESLGKLRAGIVAQEARLSVMRPELDQARKRQREVAEANAAELQARQTYESLAGRVRQWRADIASRQRVAEQLEAITNLHAARKQELDAAQAAQPKIAGLEKELESLQQSGVDAKAWPDLVRLRSLSEEVAELRAQRDALIAPAPGGMAELRSLHQQLQVKEAALDAASLRFTVEAEEPLTIETAGNSRTLDVGERFELVSPQSISLRIPGVARLTAASANAQAAGLADEVLRLQEKLTVLLRGEELAVWEDRFARRDQLQRKLESADAELRPLLLRRGELNELGVRRAEWATQPPDIDSIRNGWKACRESLDSARAQFDLPKLSAAEATARAALLTCQAQGAQLAASLVQHAATGSLEALELQRTDAESHLTTARALLRTLQSIAAPDLPALEQAVHSLQAAVDQDRQAAARLEGELAAMQSQNLYSRLAEAEEQLAECSSELDRHRRRAAALQLLQTTLAESQRALSAALPNQIAEFATINWRRIAGAGAPAIRIDETWTPAGLQVPDASAALHELSGGEAEQVSFATRLALATQLAQAHPQLAVFDDAFLATDPSRAGRILELLAEAAQKLQILVLTCHPDRYAGLAGVRGFDLEKLKQ